MTSTPISLFGFKRVQPLLAPSSRFKALHTLFHSTHSDHADAQNTLMLRHASDMSNAILRNMSTTLGEPSQLVDPLSTAFEEAHRHYSFITVLAIMSLFILITISIVALLLGFCRKNNTVFSLRGGSAGQDKAGTPASTASQFELDDLEMDLADVETKVHPEDPSGACYYHLSDDDDEDYEDDIYDSDDEYVQVNSCSKDRRGKYVDNSKGKRKLNTRRTKKKRKLRFKDSRYYYHLHKDDDTDDEDEYDFDQHGWKDLEGSHFNKDHSTTEQLHAPKRSTTFPQLQNVLTPCIRGDNNPPRAETSYQNHTQEAALGRQSDEKTISKSTPGHKFINTFTKRPGCVESSYNEFDAFTGSQQQRLGATTDTPSEQNSKDSPALLHPESTQLFLVNKSSNPKPLVLVQKRRLGPSMFLPPSAGRGRLIKSYSLHDIPRSRTKKQLRQRHFLPPKKPEVPATTEAHHVTFRVGAVGGNTDIRIHNPATSPHTTEDGWLKR